MRRGLHRKARGGGVRELIDEQLPLMAHDRRRPKGADNVPFVSTAALRGVLALLTDPDATPPFPLELKTSTFQLEIWLPNSSC